MSITKRKALDMMGREIERSVNEYEPNVGRTRRRRFLEGNYPWTIWRVWSPTIYESMEKILAKNDNYLSKEETVGLFNGILKPLGLPIYLEPLIFQVVHFSKMEGIGYSAKILVKMNGADFQNEEESDDLWLLSAFGDLAEVLNDMLRVRNILVIWGGEVNVEQKTISLNTSLLTNSKSYMAIYRHGEISPQRNMHQQYHIPFDQTRDVEYYFQVQSESKDDGYTTILKIWPSMFNVQLQSQIPDVAVAVVDDQVEREGDNGYHHSIDANANFRSESEVFAPPNNTEEEDKGRRSQRKFFSARRKLFFAEHHPLITMSSFPKMRRSVQLKSPVKNQVGLKLPDYCKNPRIP